MINDNDLIQDLMEPTAKTPIQHIVTSDDLIDLVEILLDGPHAYISDRVSVGEDRWMVSIQTRSTAKWHRVRSWRGSRK